MQRVQRRRRGRVAREEGVHVERRDGLGLGGGGFLSAGGGSGGREKDGRVKAEALANVASSVEFHGSARASTSTSV